MKRRIYSRLFAKVSRLDAVGAPRRSHGGAMATATATAQEGDLTHLPRRVASAFSGSESFFFRHPSSRRLLSSHALNILLPHPLPVYFPARTFARREKITSRSAVRSPLSGFHSFTFAPARAPASTDDERPPNETAGRCRDGEHRHLARPASAPLLRRIGAV